MVKPATRDSDVIYILFILGPTHCILLPLIIFLLVYVVLAVFCIKNRTQRYCNAVTIGHVLL